MKLASCVIPLLILDLAACDIGSIHTGPFAPGSFEEGRVSLSLHALFTFTEGSGTWANDSSSSGSSLALQIDDTAAVEWIPSGGITLRARTLLSTPESIPGLANKCIANNAMTVEAWVKPASIVQNGPAHIVSYELNHKNSNFTLAQADYQLEGRRRTTSTGDAGTPELLSLGNAFETNAVPAHLAYTHSSSGEGALYINGYNFGSNQVGGDFSNWDTSYRLAVGNDLDQKRPWRGDIYLVAVYCRALSPTEILHNYSIGF